MAFRTVALLALLTAVVPGVALAQNKPSAPARATGLKGRVLDATANKPVPGAAVSVGGQRVVTGAEGQFELRVEPGDWKVDVDAADYLSFTESVTLAAGEVRSIEILLVHTRAYEENVDVIAERLAPESPATLPIETRSVMAAAGSGDNIFHVLQTMPGVAATEEFGSRLSVRGGAPDENLTVMDGVEIHNPYRLFGLTSAFNPETVRRFELTAGGFNAAYGDRLSSLLIVENRAGDASKAFKGSAALSLTDGNVVAEGRLPTKMKGSWVATARRTYYDLIANRIVDAKLPAFMDVQAKAVFEAWRGHRTSVSTMLSREDTDAAFDGSTPGEEGAILAKTRNDLVSARDEWQIGARATATTTAAWYKNADQLTFDGTFRPESRRSNWSGDLASPLTNIYFSRDISIRDVSLREDVSVAVHSAHLLRAGFEVHRLRTSLDWTAEYDRTLVLGNGSSVRGGAGLPSSLSSLAPAARTGAWLQDRISLSDRVAIEPGVRLDYSSLNDHLSVSPRFTATVAVAPKTRVKASGGLFVQTPGWEKLLQSDYFVDISADGHLNLANERAWHAVTSIEREVGRTVLVRLEGYFKRYDRLIVGRLETDAERAVRLAQYDFPSSLQWSVPTEPIITSTPTNEGVGQSYGFDIFASRTLAPGRRGLSGWASYTFGIANRTAYGRTYPFEYDRRHSLSLVGTYRFGPKFDIATTIRVASGFPRTPAVGVRVAAAEDLRGRLVPAYDEHGLLVYQVYGGGIGLLNTERLPIFARVDMRATFRPAGAAGRWELYLDIINVLNRKNVGNIQNHLEADATSDRPRLVETASRSIPMLPSFGMRLRF